MKRQQARRNKHTEKKREITNTTTTFRRRSLHAHHNRNKRQYPSTHPSNHPPPMHLLPSRQEQHHPRVFLFRKSRDRRRRGEGSCGGGQDRWLFAVLGVVRLATVDDLITVVEQDLIDGKHCRGKLGAVVSDRDRIIWLDRRNETMPHCRSNKRDDHMMNGSESSSKANTSDRT